MVLLSLVPNLSLDWARISMGRYALLHSSMMMPRWLSVATASAASLSGPRPLWVYSTHLHVLVAPLRLLLRLHLHPSRLLLRLHLHPSRLLLRRY